MSFSWPDVGNLVTKAAPAVGSLLGGPAGGAVGALVASALGSDATPDAVADAIQADPEALTKLRKMEMAHQEELLRMQLEAETTRLTQVNKTARAEAASDDPYVRRWRPTFGYAVALAWIVQAIGIIVACLYAVYATPEQAGDMISAVGHMVSALSMQWSVALAVLGVNAAKESHDKQVAAGQPPDGGILGAVAQRLRGLS